MIAANGAVARFLAAAGRSAIRRVVREPRRWDRIADDRRVVRRHACRRPPTARRSSSSWPARRAADPLALPRSVAQRREAARPGEYVLDWPGPADDVGPLRPRGARLHPRHRSEPPLRRPRDAAAGEGGHRRRAGAVYRRRARRDRAALHRARERRQQASSASRASRPPRLLLERRIGATFDAIVTGVKRDATYVRLLSPPAEGRVVARRRAAWTSASACASACCARTRSAATSISNTSDKDSTRDLTHR